jgi:hypothetical protein
MRILLLITIAKLASLITGYGQSEEAYLKANAIRIFNVEQLSDSVQSNRG